ncbi:hypothetical protein Q1695_002615 [Nippostrongylus brasiliensis]|nr:hypothetical protein Q1695_002615 [Nippostrongylus brasiliensis]
MATIEREWRLRRKRIPNVSFEQYCEDPFRWATSGGAPAVDWGGERLRTKWSWALFSKHMGIPISVRAREYKNVAHVALKEESKKTRLVITTPMRSYLRQCYALYRAGTCHALKSPISTPAILAQNMDKTFRQYVGVDAKGFDHQIPLWFVIAVMRMVGRVGECEELIEEEVAELSSLRIELFGEVIPYRGGVLSGWRMTSLIGTMASELLCRWCARNNEISWMVQGDDVLIMGNDIDRSALEESIAQMRLVLKDPLEVRSNHFFGALLTLLYVGDMLDIRDHPCILSLPRSIADDENFPNGCFLRIYSSPGQGCNITAESMAREAFHQTYPNTTSLRPGMYIVNEEKVFCEDQLCILMSPYQAPHYYKCVGRQMPRTSSIGIVQTTAAWTIIPAASTRSLETTLSSEAAVQPVASSLKALSTLTSPSFSTTEGSIIVDGNTTNTTEGDREWALTIGLETNDTDEYIDDDEEIAWYEDEEFIQLLHYIVVGLMVLFLFVQLYLYCLLSAVKAAYVLVPRHEVTRH